MLPPRIRRSKEVWHGTDEGRKAAKEALETASSLHGSISDLTSKHPSERARPSPPEDSPLFVMAAGWRSGSTLLQRMIMAKRDTLIWGEPYDRSCIVQRMAETIRPFSPRWPAPGFFIENKPQVDENQWVANLYPPIHNWRDAHRRMLLALFYEPAAERGYKQWGIKEVRWDIAHAEYLQWLFPGARFILTYRNPFDAYRSYKPWRRWFQRWPEEPVLTPYAFGRMWDRMVSDFIDNHHHINGLLAPYEELEDKSSHISEHIGGKFAKPSEIQKKKGRDGQNPPLTWTEKRIIAMTTHKARRKAGYP